MNSKKIAEFGFRKANDGLSKRSGTGGTPVLQLWYDEYAVASLVQTIPREQKDEAVSVLSAAFHDYPVMRFVCRSSGAEYEKDLNALVGFFCEIRYVRNSPVFGIRLDGNLVAVVLMNEPTPAPLRLPEEQLSELRGRIGDSAFERLAAYEEKSSEPEPKTPHHFLGMIGVPPEHRGKGYAGVLLDEVERIAMQDPNSTGVCLSTELPENVPLYEHFGYRVIAEVDIDELHSWIMFLSKK